MNNQIKEQLQKWCNEQSLTLNETFFNDLMKELKEEKREDDVILEHIGAWYYEYILGHCEHEDYEIEEEEDYNGRCCLYASCPYCGKTGSVWTNETAEGPEQEIDWE